MKANSDKSKQSNKATHRVLAGVLCGASVLSLVLSLVMPPISQAIANDTQAVPAEEAVADENTLGEEAGAGNSTGKDAENQNSDDDEGGETNPTNDVEQNQAEDQLEDEQRGEDGETSDDNAVKAVAEGGQAETASGEIDNIDSADELKNKLESAKGTANFELASDIDTSTTIQLDEDGSNITLNLNGHKIKYTNQSQPLFNITGGATLTIKDLIKDSDLKDSDPEKASERVTKVQELNNQGQNLNLANYGKAAEFVYNNDIPSSLAYYVTESSPSTADITKTTETLSKHSVNIYGAIVACNDSNRVSLINLNGKDCTFNLQGGVLTQKNNCNVDGLIYAQNGSTVDMSGGYVCGASMGRNGAGAGIHVEGSTLEISGGVIAGNYAPSGGGVYARNSTVNMVGGIISGNGTNNDQSGYGAGICAENSNVTITNGHITNNRYQHYIDEEGSTKHLGNGCHGGGGIAAFNGGSLVISGGYITGNYSAEAGGGIYAGAWNRALSTFTFYGGTIASNVAEHSEGGGIRISAPTKSVFEVPIDSHADSHAYITNNTTNTTNDWGGGGVFVQGGSDGVQPASLRISNALITNNSAQGYGGGFAACPTGKTAITDTNGIAIFGNTDANGKNHSGGTGGKSEDRDKGTPDTVGEITETFKSGGHKDLFLIHNSGNTDYIAAVTGQMLGGGAANWSGTIDDTSTSIGKYEGAQAKYMIGLKSEPIKEDMDAATAAASLFITGNRSNIHGGGIMTNGNVIAGSTTQVSVYPKMKLNGTKALTGRTLDEGEFKFQLLKQNKSGEGPYFDKDNKLQLNDCPKVGDGDGATNDAVGNFAFDLGRVNSVGTNVYYLVEDPGDHVDGVDGVYYDKTIYKIELTTRTETRPVLDIDYIYYLVTNVTVTNLKTNNSNPITPTNSSDISIEITDGNTGKTFTNAYTPKGSWTPQVTKEVDGGEMKAFKLELANDENFTNPETVTIDPTHVTTDENGNATSTVNFTTKNYELKDPENGAKTFTYYVREKEDSSTYPHYKFDQSVYQITVKATDGSKGKINISATYKQIRDRNGNKVTNDTDHDLTDTSNPTFTNTYSTSLPLSGMSGVTLTYLAGAAVLCAAAAWMHIRRKANAKGGERRE